MKYLSNYIFNQYLCISISSNSWCNNPELLIMSLIFNDVNYLISGTNGLTNPMTCTNGLTNPMTWLVNKG